MTSKKREVASIFLAGPIDMKLSCPCQRASIAKTVFDASLGRAEKYPVCVYEATGTGAIAVEEVPHEKTHLYGIVDVKPAPIAPFGERLLRIRDLVEKPKTEMLPPTLLSPAVTSFLLLSSSASMHQARRRWRNSAHRRHASPRQRARLVGLHLRRNFLRCGR